MVQIEFCVPQALNSITGITILSIDLLLLGVSKNILTVMGMEIGLLVQLQETITS